MTKLILTLLLVCSLPSVGAAEPTLIIDAAKPAARVSPRLYGLMTEEINHSYDGGLYAELVRNRAFLDDARTPVHWSVVQHDGASAKIALDPKQPLNGTIPVSLRFEARAASPTATAGVANEGFWGIPVKPATRYRASFHAKAAPGFSGPVTVSIESDDGATVYARARVRRLATEWRAYEVRLKTGGKVIPTAKARLVVSVEHPGTVWFSLVSLFPPTWKNQPNGFRKDLMRMLVELKPKFLRFPGGNYLEGDTIDQRFKWWETLGPLTNRPGHLCPWGYRSSDGMGLMEFLLWCEDMGAEPVLGVYAGYSLKGDHVNPGPALEPFIQEALNEIEYVTGPVTSQWGARRAKDGHAKPFPLHYVEIGNEDFFDRSGSYDGRFAQFYDAIKAKYPQLKCISSVGNEQPAGKRVHSRKPDLLDEHYYRSVDTFLKESSSRFEKYDRKGPEIFVGEWAAYETSFPPWDRRSRNEPPTPDMWAAIGDAAWMTGMERNSDLIQMQCYAPLFVNVNGRQWRPDLIGYDALRAYGSPSYYAIKMFSRNVGDEILKATLSEGSNLHYSVTKDSRTGMIYIKLVNPGTEEQPLAIRLNGITSVSTKGTAEILSADPTATNSIDEPTKVVPVTAKVEGIKSGFTYKLPASSVVVLTIKAR